MCKVGQVVGGFLRALKSSWECFLVEVLIGLDGRNKEH
jgi:hypothetical protein